MDIVAEDGKPVSLDTVSFLISLSLLNRNTLSSTQVYLESLLYIWKRSLLISMLIVFPPGFTASVCGSTVESAPWEVEKRGYLCPETTSWDSCVLFVVTVKSLLVFSFGLMREVVKEDESSVLLTHESLVLFFLPFSISNFFITLSCRLSIYLGWTRPI